MIAPWMAPHASFDFFADFSIPIRKLFFSSLHGVARLWVPLSSVTALALKTDHLFYSSSLSLARSTLRSSLIFCSLSLSRSHHYGISVCECFNLDSRCLKLCCINWHLYFSSTALSRSDYFPCFLRPFLSILFAAGDQAVSSLWSNLFLLSHVYISRRNFIFLSQLKFTSCVNVCRGSQGCEWQNSLCDSLLFRFIHSSLSLPTTSVIICHLSSSLFAASVCQLIWFVTILSSFSPIRFISAILYDSLLASQIGHQYVSDHGEATCLAFSALTKLFAPLLFGYD